MTEREGTKNGWLACVLSSGGGRSSSTTERKRGEVFELRPWPAVYLFNVHNASRLGQQHRRKGPGFSVVAAVLPASCYHPYPDLSLPKGGRSPLYTVSLLGSLGPGFCLNPPEGALGAWGGEGFVCGGEYVSFRTMQGLLSVWCVFITFMTAPGHDRTLCRT